MSDVPRASAAETAGVLGDVLLPLFARGIIVRRPRMTGLQDRLDADRRAVRRLQLLRERHGGGPVGLRIPGRKAAVVLSPGDVTRVLDETPDPFATATREKTAALAHFQPRGVLISHGVERADRRRFNEAVLDSHTRVHSHADALLAKLDDEAQRLLRLDVLTWDDFAQTWWRIVRRVVLGDAAREDHELTDMLRQLRGDANWAFMKPQRRRLRERFLTRLAGHLERAEPGSLAALFAATPATPATHPVEQVPQWLFAFDAAGMATLRALALLDAHGDRRTDDAFLRAALLESVRLWPTTPAILRETTTATTWDGRTLAAGTTLLIHAPFFHRDATRLEFADRFAPELWLQGEPEHEWPLVPFSAGPAECAGRNVVLLLGSSLLARLRAGRDLHQNRIDANRPLPATLSPFSLRFEVRRR